MTKKIQLAIGTSTTPIPVLPIPIKEPRDPDERDFGYEVGQLFYNTMTHAMWMYAGIINAAPEWFELFIGPSNGPILEITVDSGTSPVKPNNNGNIDLTSSDGTISVNGSTADTIDLTAGTPLLKPAFGAHLSTSTGGVTGGNPPAVYNVVFDAEDFDQLNNFSGGVFTAPVDGKYFFYTSLNVTGITAAMFLADVSILIRNAALTPLQTVRVAYLNPVTILAGAATLIFNGSGFVNMSATDTAIIQVTITGGVGDTAALQGGTLDAGICSFGGYLVY